MKEKTAAVGKENDEIDIKGGQSKSFMNGESIICQARSHLPSVLNTQRTTEREL